MPFPRRITAGRSLPLRLVAGFAISRTCRIVVADDNPDVRAIVGQALRLEGYQVEVAANGREAVDAVAREVANLLILDLQMPVLDGPGTIAELRRRGIAVPVVIMAGSADARRKTRELGAAGYLVKPFDLDELLAIAERFCLVDRP